MVTGIVNGICIIRYIIIGIKQVREQHPPGSKHKKEDDQPEKQE